MKYYSTNKKAPAASLKEAVIKGLAPDRGLYMPERINRIDGGIISRMKDMDFQEIACIVARNCFGEDMDQDMLDGIVKDALPFDMPVVRLRGNIHALELFHGPTLAFKDVGGRFMARMLNGLINHEPEKNTNNLNVLVATSGDTGSAVANGFLGVEGINVFVLYPKGRVSPMQECQFATLGGNVTALEIDGSFDDCQALVKTAFMDDELNDRMRLTSANSINVARFLPQSFYYFHAYAQLDRIGRADELVVSVPSGNFGNLAAGLFAHRMGLPVKRFIAANNRNDVVFEYLKTGHYSPRASVSTLANAMDVGDPSNFARIMALFEGDNPHRDMEQLVSGSRSSDRDIEDVMRRVYANTGYILDPHGACGYHGFMNGGLSGHENGLFLATAHPAKFKESVDRILDIDLPIPDALHAFMKGTKKSVALSRDFSSLKNFLMDKMVSYAS